MRARGRRAKTLESVRRKTRRGEGRRGVLAIAAINCRSCVEQENDSPRSSPLLSSPLLDDKFC